VVDHDQDEDNPHEVMEFSLVWHPYEILVKQPSGESSCTKDPKDTSDLCVSRMELGFGPAYSILPGPIPRKVALSF
jgi:hypothetical protein